MNEQKNNAQEMSTTKRINEVSNNVIKAAKVIRTLAIVGLVLASLSCILFGCLLNPDIADKLVNEHGEIAASFQYSKKTVDYGIVTVTKKISIGQLYETGELADAMKEAIGTCVTAILAMVMLLVILKIVIRVFTKLAESETPFTTELLKEMKVLFIILTVLCAFSSIGVALIVGLTLRCLYEIFRYGNELQTEADETL